MTGTGPPSREPWRLSRKMRGVVGVCFVAFLIHLIPLFLPRNMPEQELAIARATPDVQHRVTLLRPLKEHQKATAADLREAAELLVEGAPAEAQELAQEAERREPGAVETQLLLARICRVERMERCVKTALERAAQVAPMDARPDLLQADMQERDGDLARALEAVGRAHRKVPEDVVVAARYARLLSEAGRFSEADAVLDALDGRVAPAKLWVERGLLRVRQGRDKEARQLFLRAVEEDPKLALAHYYLGMAHFRLGDELAAEESLREADRRDMADPRSLTALCVMQVQVGQLEAARITKMDLERRFPERSSLFRDACRTDP